MTRKTTVTLPDGTIAKRTSKSRHYTVAVVVEETAEARVADALRESAAYAAQVAKYEAAIESGALTSDLLKFSFTTGPGTNRFYLGGVYVGSRDADLAPMTREEAVEAVAKYRDDALARVESYAARAAEQEGTAPRYGVVRWSEKRESAEAFLRSREGRYYADRGRVWIEEVQA